ncbi:hypothetical protein [Flavobacterium sp.]|uniref:hypothetical protein n=1 Tax=Flavobacterium sp. TaxID=239 RepID=UPI00261A2196|nr:hypothetical protein [Flavobacterium sp.]
MKNYKPLPLEQGNYYHIYNRGNNSINVFFDNESYRYFLKLLEKYTSPIADIYAWCLLKNHFHILVYIRIEKEIKFDKLKYSTVEKAKVLDASKQFGHLFNAYTQAINKKFNRTGSLFEKRFSRKLVSSSIYLKNLICYIHYNPVKHGFASKMSLYHWSSFNDIFSTEQSTLRRDDVIEIFGGKEHFLAYHMQQQNGNAINESILE